MYPFSDKENMSHWVTPSDMYVGLMKADIFPEEVVHVFADTIRNARLDAQYEMYKDLAKGTAIIPMNFEEFRKVVGEQGFQALFVSHDV